MGGGVLPEWLLAGVAAAAIFVVMLDLGLAIVPGESRWVAKRPVLVAKALFTVLIAVPAIAWMVLRVFDFPREIEIGIMLMAISPGAPVALRRSIGAGGHPSFAPALQIAVAALAVVSVPLAIAAFDEYYAGTASIEPRHLARQVRQGHPHPREPGRVAEDPVAVGIIRPAVEGQPLANSKRGLPVGADVLEAPVAATQPDVADGEEEQQADRQPAHPAARASRETRGRFGDGRHGRQSIVWRGHAEIEPAAAHAPGVARVSRRRAAGGPHGLRAADLRGLARVRLRRGRVLGCR